MSRTTRWTARAACLTALAAPAALLAASSAFAYGGGFNPAVTPAAFPGTSTAVHGWKLTGTGAATNVQVAPRWVISSKHAGLTVGKTYQAPTGQTSKVVAYYAPSQARTGGGNADISVSLLETAIAAPTGGFPYLLTEAIGTDLNASLPGYVLWSGQGATTAPPVPSVGWARPDGFSYTGSRNLESVGGDSGSTGLLYRTSTARPIMPGVVDYAMGTTRQFGADTAFSDGLVPATSGTSYASVTAWLQAQLAKHTVATPPTFASFAGAGIAFSTLKPSAPRGIAVSAATPTSATVAWRHATDTRVPRTGYRVTVSPSGRVINLGSTATSTTITGLATGTNYTFTVKAVNANGESNVARAELMLVASGTPESALKEPQSVSYKLRPNPGAVQGLTVTGERDTGSGSIQDGGSGQPETEYCVVARFGAATPGTGSTITRYETRVNGTLVNKPLRADGTDPSITPGDDGKFTVRRCGLQAGAATTVQVIAKSDVQAGPVAQVTASTPTGAPRGTPFTGPVSLSAPTRRAVADRATDYCVDASWQLPAPIAGFPVTGWSLLIHSSNYAYVEGFDLELADTKKTICGLSADRGYKIVVNATYGDITAREAFVLFETPTGAPRGTAFGVATTSATANVSNNLGKADYCVTAKFTAPASVDGFPIVDHEVYVYTPDLQFWKIARGVPTGSGERSSEQCGLQPGTNYEVVVATRYRVNGDDPLHETYGYTSASTPAGPPVGTVWTKPTLTSVSVDSASGQLCATVNWAHPAPIAGAPVTAYSVLMHSTSYSWVEGSDVLSATATSHRACGLPAGRDIKAVVYASRGDHVVTSTETIFGT